MHYATNSRGGIGRFVVAVILLCVLLASLAGAQVKYRTFLQNDLAMKKAKAGKILGSRVSFSFTNPRVGPVYGMHAIFSSPILAIEDHGTPALGGQRIAAEPAARF